MNATEPIVIAAPIEHVFPGANYRKRRPKDWDQKLDELAASIKEHGLLEPIVCRPKPKAKSPEDLEVVCGERRYLASERAGVATIITTVREVADDAILDLQVAENDQREDPHPLDQADGFAELVRRGRTPQDIADRLGRDLRYVVTRLALHKLSDKCRKAFDDEKISLGVALLLAKLPSDKLQDEGLQEVASGRDRFGDSAGQMSVADARKELEESVMLMLKGAPFKADDATLVPKAGACTVCPKRTGNQAELFHDASSKDLCTDPYCFRAKTDALFQIKVKKHQEDGGEVLTKKQSDTLLGSGWSQEKNKLEQRYTELNNKVWSGRKQIPIRQLFKDDLPPITMAQDPKSGRVVQLVSKSTVDKALAVALKVRQPSGSKVSPATAAANRRERLKDSARIEAVNRALEKATAKAEGLGGWELLGAKFLRPLVLMALRHTWHDGRVIVAKRRAALTAAPEPPAPEAKPKKGKRKSQLRGERVDAHEVLETFIAKASAQELGGLLVELQLSRGAPSKWSPDVEDDDEWGHLTEALGVKYDVIHANVVEDQAKAEKAKGAKAAPASKPKAKKAAKKKAGSR